MCYDRLEWDFLAVVLGAFGFHKNFIEVVLKCVSLVTSILLNGSPFGNSTPHPFSILGVEVLSHRLIKAEGKELIHGVKVARNAPIVSHLFFEDNSFLFCKAKNSKTREIKDILEDYYLASGQLINFDKSATFFSKGTCCMRCRELTKILGVKLMDSNEKYLGNPIINNRSKNTNFLALISKIKCRIMSWQANFLSQAERSTLIKFVVSIVSVCNIVVL